LFGQSRFDGTYNCKSYDPKVDGSTDGSDERVAGYPYVTLAVR